MIGFWVGINKLISYLHFKLSDAMIALSSSAPPRGMASSLPSGITTLDIAPPLGWIRVLCQMARLLQQLTCPRLSTLSSHQCIIHCVVDCHCCQRQRGHWHSVGQGSRHRFIRRRRACPFCQVAVPSQVMSDFLKRCRHITLILVVILFVILVAILVIVSVGIGRRIAMHQQRRKTDDKTAVMATAVGRLAMTEDDGRQRQYLPPPIPPFAVRFLWGPYLSGRARQSKKVAA